MLKRRNFFRILTGVAGALGLASFPSVAASKENQIPGRFVHMVFFWLQDETAADEFMRSTEAFLKQVKVIKAYHLGKPAGTPRDVVDNSYTVSLVVTFDSKEDQDLYQNHPIHVQYVEEHKDKWHKVQIYDSWGKA